MGALFLQKMSATLHGSAGADEAPRCPKAARDLYPHPQTTKREPFARRAFGEKNVKPRKSG